MFVRRSKYKDLEARCAWLGEQLAETREELADWKGSALRVAARNTELTRCLEDARECTGDVHLKAELYRSEKARAALDADRAELIRINDDLNRQLREIAENAAGGAS